MGTRSVRVICRCASAEDHNFAVVYNFSFFFFLARYIIRRDGDALHIAGVVSASWTTKATTVEQMAIGIVETRQNYNRIRLFQLSNQQIYVNDLRVPIRRQSHHQPPLGRRDESTQCSTNG